MSQGGRYSLIIKNIIHTLFLIPNTLFSFTSIYWRLSICSFSCLALWCIPRKHRVVILPRWCLLAGWGNHAHSHECFRGQRKVENIQNTRWRDNKQLLPRLLPNRGIVWSSLGSGNCLAPWLLRNSTQSLTYSYSLYTYQWVKSQNYCSLSLIETSFDRDNI